MNKVSIVTLSKFPEIFASLAESMVESGRGLRKILVDDGGGKHGNHGWLVVEGAKPFCFAKNANIGICEAGADDVLLVNDDVRIEQFDAVPLLQEALYSQPRLGLVAPRVNGVVGNFLQAASEQWPGHNPVVAISKQRLAFVCVLIRRQVIDEIGLLDERFNGYGGDDTDFCERAQQAGWDLGVTKRVHVSHGFGGLGCSSSFRRVGFEISASMDKMQELLDERRKERLTVV